MYVCPIISDSYTVILKKIANFTMKIVPSLIIKAQVSNYVLLITYCERSELSGLFNGTDFLYIYFRPAVHRAVNVLNVSTCI